MTSKMEDVARAIYETPGAERQSEQVDWLVLPIPIKDYYRKAARAAVEALLPPDDAMIEAAARAIDPMIWTGIDFNPETWAWRKEQEMKVAKRALGAALSSILNPATGG